MIELPGHLSYSQVTTMLKCPHQWYLQRGLSVPQQPAWALVGGTAVHETTEIADLAALEGPRPDNLRDIFNDCLERETESQIKRWDGRYTRADFRASGRASKMWPNKEDEAWWRANGPAFAAAWVNFLDRSPNSIYMTGDGVPAIEWELEVTLGGMPVKVVIDRVLAGPHGLVIVDIKSGAQLPKDSMQLAIYRQAILENLGLDIRWGQFYDARKGLTTPAYDLSAWSQENLDYVFRSVRTMQEANIFPAAPNNNCASCPVRDYCLTMGGSKAHEVPQPWSGSDSMCNSTSEHTEE